MTDLMDLARQVRGLPAGMVLGRSPRWWGLIVESTGPRAPWGEQMIIHLDDAARSWPRWWASTTTR